MVIKDFTNTNFVILSYLYDEKNEENIIKITQNEVADNLNLSRVTVNKAFAIFVQNGYISKDAKHVGRYSITALGCKIVDVIRIVNAEANVAIANGKKNKFDIF